MLWVWCDFLKLVFLGIFANVILVFKPEYPV